MTIKIKDKSHFKLEDFLVECVPYGHWKRIDYEGEDLVVCSRCEGLAPYNKLGEQYLSRHCPTCGARIEEVNNERVSYRNSQFEKRTVYLDE